MKSLQTDDGSSGGNSSRCLWQGELKMYGETVTGVYKIFKINIFPYPDFSTFDMVLGRHFDVRKVQGLILLQLVWGLAFVLHRLTRI